MRPTSLLHVVLVVLVAACMLSSSSAYDLKVQIDRASLVEIRQAGQQVIIARQPPSGGWFTVFCAFAPFENNYISWNDTSYGIYASETPLRQRSPVVVGSWAQPAYPGLLYPFINGAFMSPHPQPGIASDEFGVTSSDSRPALFGLVQDVSVNNQWMKRVPISAVELLRKEYDVFPKDPTMHVFLAPQDLKPGVMSRELFSIAETYVTTLPFRSSSQHVVQWVSDQGRFIICSD